MWTVVLCGVATMRLLVPVLRTRALAFACAWLLAGCILPVSTEFEDPENYSPYLVSASPQVGAFVGENESIAVTLADPNPGDVLSLRWVFNYPPFAAATSRFSLSDKLTPSVGGGELRTRVVSITPICFRDLVGGAEHRAMLIVSDRGFLDPVTADLPFDNVPKEARVLRMTWTIKKVCQ